MEHDQRLFGDLLAILRRIDPDIRNGATFGWPGAYLGRRLVACVFHNNLAIKVPEEFADDAVTAGKFKRFRPFGIPTSREWIVADGPGVSTASLGPVLIEAVRHARSRTSGTEPVEVPAEASM